MAWVPGMRGKNWCVRARKTGRGSNRMTLRRRRRLWMLTSWMPRRGVPRVFVVGGTRSMQPTEWMIRLDWKDGLNGWTMDGLAWNSGIGSGLSVLGRMSSSSASSSDASSRYAVRSGMRRFGFGEMISSGDTTVAGGGGGDSGALQVFKGRGERDGVNVMRGPWVS